MLVVLAISHLMVIAALTLLDYPQLLPVTCQELDNEFI
jgi:hypothetical protein